MPRIRGLTKEEAAPEARQIFEEQEHRYGAPLKTTPVYALRPTILLGVTALAQGVAASGLIDPQMKDLACLRAALINGCPF